MFLFCFTKILNQAFLHDLKVSLHIWQLWPTMPVEQTSSCDLEGPWRLIFASGAVRARPPPQRFPLGGQKNGCLLSVYQVPSRQLIASLRGAVPPLSFSGNPCLGGPGNKQHRSHQPLGSMKRPPSCRLTSEFLEAMDRQCATSCQTKFSAISPNESYLPLFFRKNAIF